MQRVQGNFNQNYAPPFSDGPPMGPGVQGAPGGFGPQPDDFEQTILGNSGPHAYGGAGGGFGAPEPTGFWGGLGRAMKNMVMYSLISNPWSSFICNPLFGGPNIGFAGGPLMNMAAGNMYADQILAQTRNNIDRAAAQAGLPGIPDPMLLNMTSPDPTGQFAMPTMPGAGSPYGFGYQGQNQTFNPYAAQQGVANGPAPDPNNPYMAQYAQNGGGQGQGQGGGGIDPRNPYLAQYNNPQGQPTGPVDPFVGRPQTGMNSPVVQYNPLDSTRPGNLPEQPGDGFQTSLNQLEPQDQANYQGVRAFSGSEETRQLLDKLLHIGALSNRDAEGTSLAANLARLAGTPASVGVSPQQLLSQAVKTIADPAGTVQQGGTGTTASANVEFLMAHRNPSELVRVFNGLVSPEGWARGAGGQVFQRTPDALTPDTTGRSAFDRILQGSFAQQAGPAQTHDQQTHVLSQGLNADMALINPAQYGLDDFMALVGDATSHQQPVIATLSDRGQSFQVVVDGMDSSGVHARFLKDSGPVTLKGTSLTPDADRRFVVPADLFKSSVTTAFVPRDEL